VCPPPPTLQSSLASSCPPLAGKTPAVESLENNEELPREAVIMVGTFTTFQISSIGFQLQSKQKLRGELRAKDNSCLNAIFAWSSSCSMRVYPLLQISDWIIGYRVTIFFNDSFSLCCVQGRSGGGSKFCRLSRILLAFLQTHFCLLRAGRKKREKTAM